MTIHRYSVSQVTQGKHKFYTCTIPSDVLANCCFVTTRYDDPKEGFQRVLDKSRAQEIANYIDNQMGTIPSSVILSAQAEANLKIVGSGKTLEFSENPKAFLIIDGQHRVYGFSLAKSELRIPVVIYNGLTRQDETRLFIDINSKQKGVPNELLLDIKQLADYENDQEALLREVFDLFHQDSRSILLGKLSPADKTSGKISRVTFNSALKPILNVFSLKSSYEIYEALNSYLICFTQGLQKIGTLEYLKNAIVFKATIAFFPSVAAKVKDRYGADYSADNFESVMKNFFSKIKASRLKDPGTSYKQLKEYFEDTIKVEFSL